MLIDSLSSLVPFTVRMMLFPNKYRVNIFAVVTESCPVNCKTNMLPSDKCRVNRFTVRQRYYPLINIRVTVFTKVTRSIYCKTKIFSPNKFCVNIFISVSCPVYCKTDIIPKQIFALLCLLLSKSSVAHSEQWLTSSASFSSSLS